METLSSHGMSMPELGLGTWKLAGTECRDAVLSALELGYRHLDTAERYANEDGVGLALAATDVPREQIHVTSKVWWDHLAPSAVAEAIDDTLRRLGTEYVDLYLVHWPAKDMDLGQTLDAMMKVRNSGKARAIGVANFPVALLDQACALAPIAANQVEYHLLLSQDKLLDACRRHGVVLTAYCPLAQGRLAEHPELETIARKHGATPAQVALKWLLDQDGVSAIPKAGRRVSQEANLGALAVTLDDADRAAIAALPKDQRFVNPDFSPAWDA